MNAEARSLPHTPQSLLIALRAAAAAGDMEAAMFLPAFEQRVTIRVRQARVRTIVTSIGTPNPDRGASVLRLLGPASG